MKQLNVKFLDNFEVSYFECVNLCDVLGDIILEANTSIDRVKVKFRSPSDITIAKYAEYQECASELKILISKLTIIKCGLKLLLRGIPFDNTFYEDIGKLASVVTNIEDSYDVVNRSELMKVYINRIIEFLANFETNSIEEIDSEVQRVLKPLAVKNAIPKIDNSSLSNLNESITSIEMSLAFIPKIVLDKFINELRIMVQLHNDNKHVNRIASSI